MFNKAFLLEICTFCVWKKSKFGIPYEVEDRYFFRSESSPMEEITNPSPILTVWYLLVAETSVILGVQMPGLITHT